MMRSRYQEVIPYRTRDDSEIRELMHPACHGNTRQSLAEATVAPGATTLLHRHRESEEIYHVTCGTGRMRLGEEEFDIAPGDTVCIAPGVPHALHNIGPEPLRLLCSCAPAYRHEDTEILGLPTWRP